MATSTASLAGPAHVPLPYRAWFMYIDPVLSVMGVYGCFFDPSLILSSYIPTTIPNPSSLKPGGSSISNPAAVANPAHHLVFAEMGGFLLLTIILSTFLLRYTRDLVVWKLYQGAISIVDVVILVATFQAYVDQGRLNPTTWRSEDWFSVLITGACAVLRIAFVLGVGVTEGKPKTR
ncbi:hypothetical protein GE09DRAFT_639213 [Coniochaeta sp. 2T2.1]|nr:hypothetical protein GE09DRAFT_639213 [Coniochaeta sp. 2T2.1]